MNAWQMVFKTNRIMNLEFTSHDIYAATGNIIINAQLILCISNATK